MSHDIMEDIRKIYARAVTQKTSCCASNSCCGVGTENIITSGLYGSEDISGLPPDAVGISLGCGNPTAMTELYPGEVVLDLGSGAGLDVLLSAQRVSPGGKAYGLDMTDEMLAEAMANQERAGITNAEFLKGHMEDIPLPDSSIDVIISNCVINLSPDKDRVLKEAFRVLKAGGRFAVADIVLTRPLPLKIRNSLAAWAGCVGGALLEDEYRQKLASAGFTAIEIQHTRVYDLTGPGAGIIPDLSEEEASAVNGAVVSAFIRAKKPADY